MRPHEGHSSRGPSPIYGRSSKTEVALQPDDWCHRFEAWWSCPSQGRCLSREEEDHEFMGGQASWGSMSDHNRHPLYEVKDQHENSCILHQNWLLLIASEAGVLLHVGVCLVLQGCTSPTPVKTTTRGSDNKTMPQEDNGLVITQHQARKTSLGWINGKLQLLPWTSTRASIEDGWRFQVMCGGCGCLLGQNGWWACMHLVEG